MFLGKQEQGARASALEALLGKVDEIESGKLGKKPVVAEMSVSAVKPEGDLLSKAMAAAGHEGVDEAEESLFPKDEEKEEMPMEGGSQPSPEQLAMIEELYNRYVRG